jgi:hypothetical protein
MHWLQYCQQTIGQYTRCIWGSIVIVIVIVIILGSARGIK